MNASSISGSNLDLKVDYTIIIGNFNRIHGNFNHVIGRDNEVDGDNNMVMGCNTKITGCRNRYIGIGIQVEGDFNECMNCSPPNDLVEIIKSCSKYEKPMVIQSKTNEKVHSSGSESNYNITLDNKIYQI